MTLRQGEDALRDTGTLAAHSKCFQMVANEQKCVISSRAVGEYVTGLLRESYATKGFHNKAKSCKWGPMAGFVLADPRFGKTGEERESRETQRSALFKALTSGAKETPLYISEARRQELLKPPLNAMRHGWDVDYDTRYYFANSPTGRLMLFMLKRTQQAPGSAGKDLWAVNYALTEAALTSGLRQDAARHQYVPVKAMVDPDCPASVASTYRAATTGDYDLFAVFPKREGFSSRGQDKRPVPGTERFKAPISQFIAHEDPHLGNITFRVKKLMWLINHYARTVAGYQGGDIVHHSDEAGRPLISVIDFPFIGWIPDHNQPYAVRNVGEFKEFIALVKFEYQLMLNPGWLRHLGFSVSSGGSYEWP
jgi:hypothetical protein